MSLFYSTVALWLTMILVFVLPIAHILRKADRGEFDMANAFGAIILMLGLYTAAIMSANTPVIFFIFGALLLYCGVIPWLGSLYSRELHLQIDDRYIEKCRTAVACDDRNSGCHALLAEACLQHRLYIEAVTHYEIALTLSPDPEFNPQHARWLRRLEVAREKEKREKWVWLFQRVRWGQRIRWGAYTRRMR